MSDITGTTRTQTIFLRAFRTSPAGPPPSAWPSPAILRKWLRRPAFLRALASVRDAIRFQSDFHLASAAANASRAFADPAQADLAAQTVQCLSKILHIAHARQRVEAADARASAPTPADEKAATQAAADAAAQTALIADLKRHDVRQIRPDNRLTKEEFHKLAIERNYSPPLPEWPNFPANPPEHPFYRRLLQSSQAILWFFKLYEDRGDYRFSHILLNCKRLLPRQDPAGLPRLTSDPPTDPT